MKIKILKDIPGYKTGELLEFPINDYVFGIYRYQVSVLIKQCFAEVVKDDTDIEAIRKSWYGMPNLYKPYENGKIINLNFYYAYLVVKAVVDQLNGDWKPDWQNQKQNKIAICYDHDNNLFKVNSWNYSQESIMPYLENKENGKKVIELCEPELKVLFGIK